MFLNLIAQKNLQEKFDGYDAETKEFQESSFAGRINLTDRFLSIYNRPTRKRQLFVKPDEPLPDSKVFRHPATGEVYILGSGRQDARYDVEEGNPYVMLCMVHLVTETANGSSGRAKQFRKLPEGPPDNPGWLVDTEISESYMDVEFRTNSSEAGLYDSKIANFYAWAPLTTEVKQWDFLSLNGINYRVVDHFTDMGMRGLRLDQESDPRVNLIVTKNTRIYDPEEHAHVNLKTNYNVTGIIPINAELASWSSGTSAIQVVIEEDHIGFKPLPDMFVTFEGRERRVKSVATQAGEKQYRLTCE